MGERGPAGDAAEGNDDARRRDGNHPGNWHDAAPLSPGFAVPMTASYLFGRAQTIHGGSTKVQKIIIRRQIAKPFITT